MENGRADHAERIDLFFEPGAGFLEYAVGVERLDDQAAAEQLDPGAYDVGAAALDRRLIDRIHSDHDGEQAEEGDDAGPVPDLVQQGVQPEPPYGLALRRLHAAHFSLRRFGLAHFSLAHFSLGRVGLADVRFVDLTLRRATLSIGGSARKTPAARRFCTTCVASCAISRMSCSLSPGPERDAFSLGVGARADRACSGARGWAGVQTHIVHPFAKAAFQPRLHGGRQRTGRGGARAFDLLCGVMARASDERRNGAELAQEAPGCKSAERPRGAPCRLRPYGKPDDVIECFGLFPSDRSM